MEDYLIELQRICEKGSNELTEPEIAFLRARSSYLTGEQVEKFKQHLEGVGSAKAPALMDLTRKELEAKAGELGIADAADVKVFPNKKSLVEAIEAKQSE